MEGTKGMVTHFKEYWEYQELEEEYHKIIGIYKKMLPNAEKLPGLILGNQKMKTNNVKSKL